jgi:hypothetical protein
MRWVLRQIILEATGLGEAREIAEQQKTPITTLSVAWVLTNPAVT